MAYQVIKPFTYAGQPMARGDVWEPSGHPNDGSIIRARLVIAVPDDEPGEPPEPTALEQPRAARQRGRRPRAQAAWQDGGE